MAKNEKVSENNTNFWGYELPTNTEKLAMVHAAKMILDSGATITGGRYLEDALALLETIDDDRLAIYLADHIYPANRVNIWEDSNHRDPEIIRPVMQALFAEVPSILEGIDELDESQYDSILDYLKALNEEIGGSDLEDAYYTLCSGGSIIVAYSKIDTETRDTVETKEYTIDGHTAQRRAALAVEVGIYTLFPDMIGWEIKFLNEDIKKEKAS